MAGLLTEAAHCQAMKGVVQTIQAVVLNEPPAIFLQVQLT